MAIIDNKQLTGLNYVSVLTGFVFAIGFSVNTILIYYLYINDFGIDNFKNISNIITTLSIPALAFIVGLFVQALRYNGLRYYIYVYKKAQLKRNEGNKYPGKWQRIIFYLFRNGTVIEECRNNIKSNYNINKIKNNILMKKIIKNKERVYYDWIKKSKYPEKDIWIYAKKINKERPEDNIYQFYYTSEVFQCFDTSFLLLSVLVILSPFVIWSLSYAFYFSFSIKDFYSKIDSSLRMIIIVGLSFLFHKISKSFAKDYANRFIKAINDSLEIIEEHV